MFVVSVTFCYSQLATGLRGGWNHAWMETVDTRNISGTKSHPIDGFNVGVLVEYTFNKNFALRADIYYSQKGYTITKDPLPDMSVSSGSYTLRSDYWTLFMNYLQIPIVPTLFHSTKKYKFFAYGGPYVGYWAWGNRSGRFYINDLGSTVARSKEFNEPYAFVDTYNSGNQKDNRWDVGFTLGTGVGILVKYGEIFVECRYVHGLTDSMEFKEKVPITHSPRYQRNTEINFGFRRKIWTPKKNKSLNDESDDVIYEGEYKDY